MAFQALETMLHFIMVSVLFIKQIEGTIMRHMLTVVFISLMAILPAGSAEQQALPGQLSQQLSAQFSGRKPTQWGERVTGVRTRLATGEKVVALTLDACGSASGKGFDARLMDYLVHERIPATLFINARWIDANPELFRRLAADPLFEIANHGLRHKPASVTGRSVYGIDGTRDVVELVEEIELNARKIEAITGKRPKLYRSGTAYYDEVAVEVAHALDHEVAGYSVLGDAGATYTATRVRAAMLGSQSGDVILCHMNHPESGTAAGIISAIPELRRRGFTFVRMSDYPLQ
jgi:peptidoglycan/xylan/chitin deacetylase (PgdA/CDA1 family)